tara:strand:+ start:777 stop:1070 length:294 start_codon:yes stop_codon:yes gene_type:complete
MGWEDILKFHGEDEKDLIDIIDLLRDEIEGRFEMGKVGQENTIADRLYLLEDFVRNGTPLDIDKQHLKLFEYTDFDPKIGRILKSLFQRLKWRDEWL